MLPTPSDQSGPLPLFRPEAIESDEARQPNVTLGLEPRWVVWLPLLLSVVFASAIAGAFIARVPIYRLTQGTLLSSDSLGAGRETSLRVAVVGVVAGTSGDVGIGFEENGFFKMNLHALNSECRETNGRRDRSRCVVVLHGRLPAGTVRGSSVVVRWRSGNQSLLSALFDSSSSR